MSDDEDLAELRRLRGGRPALDGPLGDKLAELRRRAVMAWRHPVTGEYLLTNPEVVDAARRAGVTNVTVPDRRETRRTQLDWLRSFLPISKLLARGLGKELLAGAPRVYAPRLCARDSRCAHAPPQRCTPTPRRMARCRATASRPRRRWRCPS